MSETQTETQTASNAATTALVIPTNINLTTDLGPRQEQRDNVDRKQQKQVAAVAFLNKLEQEAIMRAQAPVLKKLQKEHAGVTKKLQRAAAKLVGAVKLEEESKDVKAALLAWGLPSVKLGAELTIINYDERCLEIKKTLSSGDRYGATLESEVDVEFTAEMNTLTDKREKLDEQIRDVSNLMIEAQAKLKNRANLLADAQGALALRTMDESEVDDVKAIYDNVKNGITVEKLLGAGNSKKG